jgi:hypothetical protein
MSLEKIQIGGNYTCIENCVSVEVLEFKTIELKDDSYANEIEVVIYIDDDSNMQCMEINTFSNKHV